MSSLCRRARLLPLVPSPSRLRPRGPRVSVAHVSYILTSSRGVRQGGLSTAYCANHQNELVSQVENSSCLAPLMPFQMSCQVARAYSLVGAEALGFSDEASFRAYTQANAPRGYIEGNSDYYGCKYNNTAILIAIFAIMMAGEGFSLAGQPAATLTVARQAAAEIFEVINRGEARLAVHPCPLSGHQVCRPDN